MLTALIVHVLIVQVQAALLQSRLFFSITAAAASGTAHAELAKAFHALTLLEVVQLEHLPYLDFAGLALATRVREAPRPVQGFVP